MSSLDPVDPLDHGPPVMNLCCSWSVSFRMRKTAQDCRVVPNIQKQLICHAEKTLLLVSLILAQRRVWWVRKTVHDYKLVQNNDSQVVIPNYLKFMLDTEFIIAASEV